MFKVVTVNLNNSYDCWVDLIKKTLCSDECNYTNKHIKKVMRFLFTTTPC